MRWSSLRQAAVVCGVVLMFAGPAAMAQAPVPIYPAPPVMPPPPAVILPVAPASPEAAEIAVCFCLRQAVDTLGADMGARQRSYDETRAEVSRLDAQLEQERAGIDVNNPASVARFRQLLQQRDAISGRSSGQMMADLSSVVSRYSVRANEYNARCADRPRDPVLVASVQATLTCPPP